MSMKKIAKMTGLSIATVSHAINGTRGVSERSLKLVEDAAKEIGYKPSLAAQILRRKHSGIIALIIPSSEPTNDTNSFYFGVLNGARGALKRLGYDMIVSTYPENSDHIDLSSLQVIQTRMVDGILLVPHSTDKSTLKTIEMLDVPLVLLDRKVANSSLPTVSSNNEAAAKEAVDLLIESGGRRIGFLAGKSSYSTVQERLEGYKKSLINSNILVEESMIITQLTDQEDDGYKAAAALYKKGADALFVENSMLMIGIMKFARDKKLRIPQDIAFAGFDNAPWMEVSSPPITAVQQGPNEIGEKGGEMLVRLINNEELEEKEVIVATRLIVRESHGGGGV